MQLNGFIRIVDFRLRLNAWVGIAIATKKLFNIIFHFGHFGAVIQFTRLDFGHAFNLCGVACQIAADFNTREFVLIPFGHVDGDVDAFFIRRQTYLRGINVKTRITAIKIVTAQSFKIARQFLFLVFAIAYNVPPRHFIAQLEGRDQLFGLERMVPDDVDLLDLR